MWWLGKVCPYCDFWRGLGPVVLCFERLTITRCSADYKHGIILAGQPRYPLFQRDCCFVFPIDVVSSTRLHPSHDLCVRGHGNGIA
jgi:hypothetical protein